MLLAISVVGGEVDSVSFVVVGSRPMSMGTLGGWLMFVVGRIMFRRRFRMCGVFVDLFVTEIPALLRWLRRLFFDSALPQALRKMWLSLLKSLASD